MIASVTDLKKARRQKPHADVLKTDRLPPHSVEAEQGVLGCVMLSPNECVGQCIEKFKVGAEVFYDLRHQTIYTAMMEMFDAREQIDVITLQQHLKDRQLLDQIGGIAALNALQDAVPSAANLSYYLSIVHEKFLLRQMVHVCTDCVGRIYEHEGEVGSLMDSIEADVLKINSQGQETKLQTFKTLVPQSIDVIEKCFNQQGIPSGLTTGLLDLDKMTDGLHAGEMIVIAARPSMGKTSLAMNIGEHVAIDNGLPIGVFSLEMTAEALTTRMMCSRAKVNLRKVKDGFITEADAAAITAAASQMQNAPVYIDDTGGLSVMQLRARARRMWQQHNIRLLIIDYIQLLHSTTRRADENRVQEITDISNGIKALAKELNIPIIVLSQLNREVEKRTDGKPRLSDLRESGAIEQDADFVGLLYKPSTKEPENEAQAEAQAVHLLIAKQRNGPVGVVPLTFLKNYTRFESAAKVSDEDTEGWTGHND